MISKSSKSLNSSSPTSWLAICHREQVERNCQTVEDSQMRPIPRRGRSQWFFLERSIHWTPRAAKRMVSRALMAAKIRLT